MRKLETQDRNGGQTAQRQAGISACIIYRGDERRLLRSMAELRDRFAETIVTNASGSGLPAGLVTDARCRCVEPSAAFPDDAVACGIAEAREEWVLIVEAGESVSAAGCERLKELCRAGAADAYRLLFPAGIEAGALGAYAWMGAWAADAPPRVDAAGYVPSVGIRLFRKEAVKAVRSLPAGGLQVDVCASARVLTRCDIGLQGDGGADEISASVGGEEGRRRREREAFLQGTAPPDRLPESGEIVGPGEIGYPLISEEDLPSLEAGLARGFGRVEILKWAIHNVIETGEYRKAVSLAQQAIDRLPPSRELFEIWHLKGIALFHQLDLAGAAQAMRRALELNGTDFNTLSDLVRVHIVSGDLSRAREVLDSAIAHHGRMPANEYIRQALDRRSERPVTVSLLLLCRDEERYVARALRSVRSLVDEIVAVDTGSQDRTRDILREYGARVVPFPWTDDFAAARNHGLAQVSCDYVFWMDADEFLADKDRLSFLVFKNLLPRSAAVGVVFDVRTLDGDYGIDAWGIPPRMIGKRVALFPHSPPVRFQGRVFESVDSALQTLRIPLLFAESIAIRHHHDDEAARRIRKIGAMSGSAGDLTAEGLLAGVLFWMEGGDLERAGEWFERALGAAAGEDRHLPTICKLFDECRQKGLMRTNPRIFGKLLSTYGTSYRVVTLLADHLYGLGEYDGAAILLRRLAAGAGGGFADRPETDALRDNRVKLAAASLERGDIATCDAMIALLGADREGSDAVRAVSFSRAIRTRDLDEALALLDAWVRERNMPIRGTINDFTDLLRVIAECAEVIARYGSLDAARILNRSAHYFAGTIAQVS